MDEDDDGAAAYAYELNLREQFERDQQLLRADPAFEEWLNIYEQETSHADHCER